MQPDNSEIIAIREDTIHAATMAERIAAVTAMATSIFNVFDLDASGDLNVKELGALMHELDFACDEAYLNAIIGKFGHTNGDAPAVGIDEFKEIMRLIAPGLAREAEENEKIKAEQVRAEDAADDEKEEEEEEEDENEEVMPGGMSKMQQMAWKKKQLQRKGKKKKKNKKKKNKAEEQKKKPPPMGGKSSPKPKPQSTEDGEDLFVAVGVFAHEQDGDLALAVGDIVVVIGMDGEWWSGYLQSDATKKKGNFPGSFVEKGKGKGKEKGKEKRGEKPALAEAPAPAPAKAEAAVAAGSSVAVYIAADVFPCDQDGDLALAKGDRVVVIDKQGDPWWHGYLEADLPKKEGAFPSNFVTAAGGAGSGSGIDSLKIEAASFASVGDFVSAVSTLEKALELEPENCTI